MSFDDVRLWALTASLEEMDAIQKLLRLRRDQLGVSNAMAFKPGDPVWFDAGKRGIVRGTFTKLNQKNARVTSDLGLVWTVAPHLLHKGTP